jgi:hypothetical protein
MMAREALILDDMQSAARAIFRAAPERAKDGVEP